MLRSNPVRIVHSKTNCWRREVKKPNYDALVDPHASYYFMSRPMKKHLQILKKSIQAEGKHSEKKVIESLISQRMVEYSKKIQIPAD